MSNLFLQVREIVTAPRKPRPRSRPPPSAPRTTCSNLQGDDRKAAIEDPGMGRLRDADDQQEHTHHRLRRGEDFQPGEPEARAALYQERPHLVLQADQPYGD